MKGHFSMGMIHSSMIKKAGDYLLSILIAEPTIRYSRFYNGTKKAASKIRKGMKFTDSDDFYSAEILIDLAVVVLRERGVVVTRELAARLPDGNNDYEIKLTNKGRRRIDSGVDFKFPHVEM
jgi:hypothetical protein